MFAVKAYDNGAPYTQKLEYSGTNAIYIGWADPGQPTTAARWKIQKLTYNGDNLVTDVQWANGVPHFNFVWDNRASYTYS